MHYKHKWFEKTFVNASAKKTLVEAAPEWEFSHIGVMEIATGKKYGSCQVCHARIAQFVAVSNVRNGMYLFIGADCYDKLLHYLATEKIEVVALGERRQYIVAIKKYCKKNITAAFLAWFKNKKRLPAELKKTLAVIDALGYAPNLKAAEELVEYYKIHRRFPLAELLTDEEWSFLNRSSNPPQCPKTCTLNTWTEIQAKVRAWIEAEKGQERKQKEERYRQLGERKQAAKEKGLAEMERLCHQSPEQYQKGIFLKQIFRGREEWSFEANGRKHILSDRFGWSERPEVFVTVVRRISSRVCVVWPLSMQTRGLFVTSFGFMPEGVDEDTFREMYPGVPYPGLLCAVD